jgi:hypothetical protein
LQSRLPKLNPWVLSMEFPVDSASASGSLTHGI